MNTVANFSYQLLPNSASDSSKVLSPHSYSREDYTLSWPDSDTHPHHINKKAEKSFSHLQKLYRQPLPRDTMPTAGNTFIIPIIQAGQFNIREEESIFQLLFRHLGKLTAQRPLMSLTSGYFSLYKPYQDLILQAPNLDCRIVAASPKVSFYYGTIILGVKDDIWLG
jgi:CDP-diacylglycerol--glycerol-3-phosphate 3-phosphatidyltransferase